MTDSQSLSRGIIGWPVGELPWLSRLASDPGGFAPCCLENGRAEGTLECGSSSYRLVVSESKAAAAAAALQGEAKTVALASKRLFTPGRGETTIEIANH
jgi:hypothetical protein